MSDLLGVLRHETRARWFLLASVQSSIGSGAALVALAVIAYARLHSPWAITLVLLADFLPAMLLGPIFGAAADRWSRRGCAIVADVLRAVAFLGIGLVHSFEATLALAVLAGVGTALFSPAVLAALPSLAAPERRATVTSLYGVTRDIGRTFGPLLAAVGFPLLGASNLMLVNGVTFALSAAAIASIPMGAAANAASGGHRAIFREAREGIAVTVRMPGVRIVLWASSAVILSGGMVNVGELILARHIGIGSSGFAVLMAGVGVGVILGSASGARGGELRQLKGRYTAGIAIIGLSVLGLAVADGFALALLGFVGTGFGNGLVNVYERLIFQAAVPDRLMARAFALLDTLCGWGFAIAFVAAGGLITAAGPRAMFALAGGVGLVVAGSTALAFRGVWTAATTATTSAEPRVTVLPRRAVAPQSPDTD